MSLRYRLEGWFKAFFDFTFFAMMILMAVMFWVFLFIGLYKLLGG